MSPTINLRESGYLSATPTYWPRGLESIVDYNNSAVVLNDLRRPDRIVVTSIGGLSGPDLQAGADKYADRDGESPLDATYGGRTITLRGYVEAGSLDKLRERWSYLLDGFDSPVEAPLWLRYLDWRDQFTDSLALSDYAYDAGSGTLQIGASATGLQPTTTGNKQIRILPTSRDGTSPSRFTYGDGEAIVKFRAGTSLTGLAVGPEFRRNSSVRKLRVIYEKATDTLRLYKVDTSTTQLATVASTTLVVGTDYWIRARAEGSIISFSLWSTYPPDIGGAPLASQTHTLSGGDQTLFPASTSGLGWGLYWTPNSTTDRVSLLDTGAINPGDAIINCRKVSQIESEETQVDYQWRRDFLITLRASDSRMVSRKVTKVSFTPPGTPAAQIYYSLNLTNLGRSPAAILTRFTATMINPRIYMPSTGKILGISGEYELLTAGLNWLELDTTLRTVYDNFGGLKYNVLSSETTWPELPRGTNELRVVDDKYDDFSDAVVPSNLNGRVALANGGSLGTWATSGATTDFVTQNTVGLDSNFIELPVFRSTTSDTGNGRLSFLSANNYTDARVDLWIRFSTALPVFPSATARLGIISRYVNTTNYLMVVLTRNNASGADTTYTIRSYEVVAGVTTLTGTLGISFVTIGPLINTWYILSLTMRSNGRLMMELRNSATNSSLVSNASSYNGDIDTATNWPTSSVLATAGALATGKIGIVDLNASTTAISRYYAKINVTSAVASGTIDFTYRHSSR